MATIERKAFLALLQRLKPALGTANSSIDELKHFWFDGDNVCASNGGLGIEADCKLGWEGGIPGAPLLALLANEVSDQVEFASTSPEKLELKFGKTKIALITRPLENSPWAFFNDDKKEKFAELKLTEDLLAALKRVALVKASTPTAVEHYGVTLFPSAKDKSCLVYCTNSKAIVEICYKGDVHATFERTVLPFELLSLLKAEAAPGDKLRLYSNRWSVQTKDLLIFANILDSSGVREMPDIVGKHIDQAKDTADIPKGIKAVLDRIDILAGDKPALFTISVDGKVLKMSGKLTYGDFSDELPLKQELPKAELQADGRLLREALEESKTFALTKDSLVLESGGDFTFLLARND